MIKRNPTPIAIPESQIPIEGPPPALETIEMRELDFTFVGPTVFSISLEPEDTFQKEPGDGRMAITLKRNGEMVVINPQQLMYWSERPRTIQRKVKHGH